MLGFKGAGTLSHFLGHIMLYCRQNDLPPLTVLVVNEKTSLPGSRLTQVEPNADGERLFAFDWFALVPPTPDELVTAYRAEHPGR